MLYYNHIVLNLFISVLTDGQKPCPGMHCNDFHFLHIILDRIVCLLTVLLKVIGTAF